MWESPIHLIEQRMSIQLEGDIMKAVTKVGIMVDKEELLRALQYDRKQYYRGYNDAVDEFAERLISHLEELNCEAFTNDIRQIADIMKV